MSKPLKELFLYDVSFVNQYTGSTPQEAAIKHAAKLAPVLPNKHIEMEVHTLTHEDAYPTGDISHIIISPKPKTLIQRLGLFIYHLG